MATENKNLSNYNKSELPNASAYSFGIVVSEWNQEITSNLHQGALQTLIDLGASKDKIFSWKVPGSFELVYGAKHMLESYPHLDAIIVLGCVIQGETKHFDFVCQGVTQGIMQLNINLSVPVIFGVLTDDTKEQSIARSGGVLGNKGVECAVSALKMAALGH